MNRVETMSRLNTLLEEIRACRACADSLPLGPRPVLRASTTARIAICSQAPGTRVHETGLPFNDRSGDRLRGWLGVDRDTFYDESRIAIVPMGFATLGWICAAAIVRPGRNAHGYGIQGFSRCYRST